MLLKQTAITLCSSSNLYSSSASLPFFATSSCSSKLRGPTCSLPSPCGGCTSPRTRGYATTHYGHNHNAYRASHRKKRSPNTRPPLWPTSSEPTPYEIFDLPKSAPYDKAQFYELVKLYHPDRQWHTLHKGIPHVTKLERYRLIVAANDILSNPERRRLYDLYGAGWAGQSDMQNSYRAADRMWRQEPGNPSMNATWEDWERWYNERDGKKQEPVFISNGGFAGVVVLFVLIGSVAQLTRAETNSTYLVDMRDQKNSLISNDLRRKHVQSMGLSRRDRVESFLKQREGWEHDRLSGHSPLLHDPGDNGDK